MPSPPSGSIRVISSSQPGSCAAFPAHSRAARRSVPALNNSTLREGMTERSTGEPYDLWCCSGSRQHKEDRRGACCMCSAADLLTKCPLLYAGLGAPGGHCWAQGFPGCAAAPSVLISGRWLMLKTKHSANEVGFVVTCKAKCKRGSQSILSALGDDAVTSPVLHCWAGC